MTFEDDQGAYDQFDAQGFIKLNALRLRLGAMAGRAGREPVSHDHLDVSRPDRAAVPARCSARSATCCARARRSPRRARSIRSVLLHSRLAPDMFPLVPAGADRQRRPQGGGAPGRRRGAEAGPTRKPRSRVAGASPHARSIGGWSAGADRRQRGARVVLKAVGAARCIHRPRLPDRVRDPEPLVPLHAAYASCATTGWNSASGTIWALSKLGRRPGRVAPFS